ncbi:MAG: glucuronate isomerase [Anaerolineae bacterium]
MIPTFRPDGVVNISYDGWRASIDALSSVSGIDMTGYARYIEALEQRRAFFKSMGATATDHAAPSAYTERLSDADAEAIFQRAMSGAASDDDARRFTGHMLIELARMSADDGLVMQFHVGSFRNHNPAVYQRFGRDMGADIDHDRVHAKSQPLLDRFGTRAGLTIVPFNLGRDDLQPRTRAAGGHYPALRLGPPWWFFDSFNGMRRFFDGVVETAESVIPPGSTTTPAPIRRRSRRATTCGGGRPPTGWRGWSRASSST